MGHPVHIGIWYIGIYNSGLPTEPPRVRISDPTDPNFLGPKIATKIKKNRLRNHSIRHLL